jgi:hypothetical protein
MATPSIVTMATAMAAADLPQDQGSAAPEGEEAWRPVVGWEGLYEVSNQGRVASVERINQRGLMPRLMPRTILKTSLGGKLNRYLRVMLTRCAGDVPEEATGKDRISATRIRRHAFVHHLVAEAFLGPRFELGDPDEWGDRPKLWHKVRHLNDRAEDCRAVNLAYGTQEDNELDKAVIALVEARADLEDAPF